MPKRAYYAARAIDERLRARAATDARTAASHLERSARYEALAADPGPDQPTRELAALEPASDDPSAP